MSLIEKLTGGTSECGQLPLVLGESLGQRPDVAAEVKDIMAERRANLAAAALLTEERQQVA